jgi:hypothetical protein
MNLLSPFASLVTAWLLVHAVVANEYDLSADAERMLTYLSQYSEDFSQVSVQFEEHPANAASLTVSIVELPEKRLLMRRSIDAEAQDKALFEMLSDLLLNPESTHLDPSWFVSLRDAWYWDFKVLENPALIEQLQMEAMPGHESFWKYRVSILQKGRNKTWGDIIASPETIRKFSKDSTTDPQDIAALFECIYYQSVPVLSLEASRALLEYLLEVPVSVEDQGSYRSFSELSVDTLMAPKSMPLYESRIGLIKTALVRVNPLYVNAFLSLGIYLEQLHASNRNASQLAFSKLSEDLDVINQTERLLAEMKAKEFKYRKPEKSASH